MREYLSLFMGGGEMMPLTHGYGRLGILAIAHHHLVKSEQHFFSSSCSSSVSTDHRFTQICSKLSFFSVLEDLRPVFMGVSDIPDDNLPYQRFLPVAWFLSEYSPFPEPGFPSLSVCSSVPCPNAHRLWLGMLLS